MRRQSKCSPQAVSTTWDSSPPLHPAEMSPAATLSPLPPAATLGGVGGDYPSSALAQSMAYANTWLYGTVSLKPQCRPGMFMCSADVAPAHSGPSPAFAILMCNCPEFLTGTTRSKKSLCKKCGGARTTNWNFDEFVNNSTGGVHNNMSRRYNTVRINRPLGDFNMELDPYMLMRKSRFKTQSSGGDEKNNQLVSKSSSRKSILECHVNPYDLIKFNKYYDTGQQGDSEKGKRENNTGCKINKILDTTETVNTTSGGNKKIARLLNKFKFKSSSSNATVANPNIRIAGHTINVQHSGDSRALKINEEFVKDSSESEDLDEPEVDYSDVELENDPAEKNQKEINQQVNISSKKLNNDFSPVRHNCDSREFRSDTTRDRQYKSQSFNHYTDHNIFSQRKHSMQNTLKQDHDRYSVQRSQRLNEPNFENEHERMVNTTSKLNNNSECSRSYSNTLTNDAANNMKNSLRNFKINESVISRHYDGNKRHSFDAYRMSELQKVMVHSETAQKRHSTSDTPVVSSVANSSSNRQSRPHSNNNTSHLNRSNSQISTSSSHMSFQRDSVDMENKVDLLETEIKPIPRISVKPSNIKSNTLTPVRPPRKSKSIDCTYRSSYQQLAENVNQKPRAYSMDRTNSISQIDLSRQRDQQTEDIVVIRTNKNDTIKKYKETNRSKLNMSTFKYEASDSSRSGDKESGRDYYERENDDDLDQNYILRNSTLVKDKSRNQTANCNQENQNRQIQQSDLQNSNTPSQRTQRRSSTASTHSADYSPIFLTESKAKVPNRTSSLTSDQVRDIRGYFNTIRKSPSNVDESKTNTKTNESDIQNPIRPKEKSPVPSIQVPNQNNIPQNQTTAKGSTNADQDESGSDFMYDFFIPRSNKFNSISSTNSTEIKSILKKKLDEDLMYNASVISSNDSTSGSSVLTSAGNVGGDLTRGGRKKKQVQFEAPGTPEDAPLVPMIQQSSKISFEACMEGGALGCEGGALGCEDGKEAELGREDRDEKEDAATEDHQTSATADAEDTSPSVSPSKSRKFKLQRSESDRVPLKPSNDQSNSFKDTMRIKSMRKHYNKELVDKLLLRPREPPPPPPKGQMEKKTSGEKTSGLTVKAAVPDTIKDKIPRVNIVNSRGGLLEENYENVNTAGVTKTIHLKLIKNNTDYECIKLFNKYELPSIPEEQKLSPVLIKKETGPKFVVNDAQSALLQEINDKLKRMEKKRLEKESNVYEDVDVDDKLEECSEKLSDAQTSLSHKPLSDVQKTAEEVKEFKDDTKTNESKEEIVNSVDNSLEAEPYETIELKPNKIVTTKNKEHHKENKTDSQTSNSNSVHSGIANISKFRKSDKDSDVVNKLVNKTDNQMCSSNLRENSHLSHIKNRTLPDIPKSPSTSTVNFTPKETSTPIHSRTQIAQMSNKVEPKVSDKQSCPQKEDVQEVSMVSVVDKFESSADFVNICSAPAPSPTVATEQKVLPPRSSEVVMNKPKKSSGTSILIQNSQSQNTSSIVITNKKSPQLLNSSPTLPKFHIGPNNLAHTIETNLRKDSLPKQAPSVAKVNLNVITINITPEVKKSSNEVSFARIGEPIYNGVLLSNNSTPNKGGNISSISNNIDSNDIGKEEDIYHSSSILIKHDLSHTYDEGTADDPMLDSLIEIPEYYHKQEFVIKEVNGNGPNKNKIDEIIRNVNKQTVGDNSPKIVENISKEEHEDDNKSNLERTVGEVEKVKRNVEANDAHIEEINRTFSSLIKDNYDPIQAVKDKLVPHICKNNKTNQSISVNGLDGVNIKETKQIQETVVPHEKEFTKKTENNQSEETLTDFVFNPLDTKVDKLEVPTDVIDTLSTSDYGSHYYMSSRIDTIIEDIEKEEEEEEDHYETIDGEPIYDEIPPPLPKSSPPPLPLSLPPNSLSAMSTNLKSIFEGASKSDIINYLVDAKQRFIDPSQSAHRLSSASDIDSATRSDSEYNSDLEFDFRLATGGTHLSQNSDSSDCSIVVHEDSISLSSSDSTIRKEYVDIERNDSGVGSETSSSCRARWQTLPSVQHPRGSHECEDCDEPVKTQVTDSGIKFAPLICEKCTKMRAERREIILEIIETEEKYGRDLQIIIDEFYKPMLVAGLLTQDQLESIFLNTEELLDNTLLMSDKLREAFNEGDDEMMTAHVGRIFIEAVPMLTAFQSYCTRQGTAALILANLEKEKELLRIFLRVSQMENSVLRRMNLNSFLMVPVQRVTKYPLLLARLYKVTPDHHTGKDLLIEAQHSIQLHLEHINSLARDLSTTKLWRKISMMNNRRVGYELEDTTYIKLRKLSVDVLDWQQDEVRFLLEEKLSYTQPTEHNWKRGRTVKLTPVNAVLVTLDKPTEPTTPELDDSSSSLSSPSLELANSTTPPTLSKLYSPSGVKEASLILLKEKNGRFALLREPLFLDKCIVYCDIEMEDYFELQEISTRDTFVFKAEDPDRTKLWYRQLQCLVQGLGQWRKRRNALANIMMYSIQNRT